MADDHGEEKKATIDPNEVASAVRRVSQQEKMFEKHPDAEQVANSDEFRKWVHSDPIRRSAYQHAEMSSDYEAGTRLLDEYKKATSQPKKAERTPALQTALGSQGSGSRDMGTPQTTIYNRRELLQKMAFDKNWRRAHSEEIALAAANGQIPSAR